MNSVRSKLFLIIFTGLSGTLALIVMAALAFQDYRDLQERMNQSHHIIQEAWASQNGNSSKKHLEELESWSTTLKPKHRQKALKNFLEASAPWQVKKNARFLEKTEKKFREYMRPRITYAENKIIYFGLLALAVMAVSFISAWLYLKKRVLVPLAELQQKMLDFSNDRYSFQYSVPAKHEIGDLQATFDALVKQVISNMRALKALDQAKSDFLSIASHELRTPLTSIKGSLNLLKNGVGSQSAQDSAQNLLVIAEDETDRLVRLISDILDLAKIESGKLPLKQEWLSLDELANNTVETLNGLAQTANVNLDVQNTTQIEIYSDRDRIQQVITNLISNAIKFSPENATVTLHTRVGENNQLVIEVQDQGEGISPEDQEHIFQQFRQATGPTNPLVKGTGLGLAIAKALVEGHGGTIGVSSYPGEGSTFYFTLPNWRFTLEEGKQMSQPSAGAVA